MNDDALFDEAFGQLDDPGRDALDRQAIADPRLAERRSRLREALSLMLDDRNPEPPRRLADRTRDRIARRDSEPRILDFIPRRSPIRWADIGAAAAVLLIGLMSLVPAVRHQQRTADRLGCADNLRQVGLALNQYASTYQSYPYVDPSCPASYIGTSFVQLQEAGLLHDAGILQCPCSGCATDRDELPRFDEMLGREHRRPGACRDEVRGDYAYHLGYRDGRGRSGPIPADVGDHLALAADQPSFVIGEADDGVILRGNSPNHGGGGQNVLFTGGHVDWRRIRWLSEADADLYLNQHDRIAPGLGLRDAVLSPAIMRFRD